MAKFKDLTGMRFGKLLVLVRIKNILYRDTMRAQFLVECKCGARLNIVGEKLRKGLVKSCHRCRDKDGRSRPHDGLVKYWGPNAALFRRQVR